jgi:hypothetical protein
MATYLLSLLLACAVTCAQATTYYWKGSTDTSSSGTGGAWSTLSNWSTEGVGGADATTLPGASDKFYGLENRAIDLEGQEWTIGGWDSTGDWNRYNMALWNGTLNVVGDVMTHSDTIYLRPGAKLVFAKGATFTPALNDGGVHYQWVNSGTELNILGNLNIYKYQMVVHGGGVAVINPTKWDICNNTQQKSFLKTDGGELELPNGISFSSGSTGSGFGFSLELENNGTIVLGGPVKKNDKPGFYAASFSDGTLRVTGDVSFDFDSVTISAASSLTLDVDAGASIDLSSSTYGAGATVTKTGAGDFVFQNGMTLPDTFVVSGGAVALSSSGSYDLTGITFDTNGKVKVGAAGITLTAWDNSLLSNGGFVAAIASPVAGSTILTCADASVLALARTGLNETLPEGFAVRIEGNDLVVTSAYVFNSTTVTDLNDPAGWAGGAVPSNKVVTIMGAGVSPTTTDLPPFAGITIQDGASLTIQNGGTLPSVTLADSAALAIGSGTVTLAGVLSTQSYGATVPSISIASGATFEVSGGTTFTDCALSVAGTLAATTSGDLVLGYATAGASASFGLTVNGGTISTTAGDIRFFCPVSGGTVSPIGTVAFTGATFSHDDDHGFFFGVNNPASEAVNFIFNGTTLNYPKRGYYTISGGAALSFVNGGSLYRANNQNEKFTLTVSGLASIILGEGTSSLIGESSSSGGSVGNGAMTFSPDTDGFVSLVISNATWETYHSAGNEKAVAEIYGSSVHTINQNNYNRAQPFAGFKAVNLNADATLTISNNVDSAGLDFSETFTGAGSLFFSTPRSTTRTFNFKSTTSTATGTLAADPAKNDALVIASTATWGGTVVWNGKASISHSSTADDMTFGGIDLASDFTYRIWGDGTCDHYTLTGEGFVDNGGNIVITVADGSEADPGDSWTLARVPAGTVVPTSLSSSWAITAQAVDGDDSVVDIVLSPVVSDYTFESTEFCDLTAADGWSCGYVPTNENVKVTGAGVVATISNAAAFPTFASIAVRNGATLKVLADVTLPPLTVDATSKVVFGDNETAVAATLDATLVTGYDATTEPVSLPVIEVATNATLTVAAGMKFRNVDFRLYGTITKPSTSDVSPVFGYAENGETSYLAFTADGGVFDLHANNDSVNNGAVFMVRPEVGGVVVPVGTIVLRNAVRNVTGWADYGTWDFGLNNPTSVPFDVLVDGTHIDVSGYFHAAGAAHLTLVNGSYIRRNTSCLGHYYSMAIQGSATITVEGGCYIDFTTNDGQFGIDSQSAVDTVTVRDGGAYTVSYNSSGFVCGVFVSDGGVLGVTKLATRSRTDLLRGFGSARLDGDLFIQSINIGTGSVNWDRHTKMANVPFTGTGDVVITNGVPEYPFTVTMVNGANTATGSIKVDKVEGDAETALFFADGANWAGTVVAGNVSLTNTTDGAAAATATFGTLDLASEFSIRVWKENGNIVTNDMVNVGRYENNGGKLVPTMMTDDVDFTIGEMITIGKIAKTSPNPALKVGWSAKRFAIDGDNENEILVAKKGVGLQIILK